MKSLFPCTFVLLLLFHVILKAQADYSGSGRSFSMGQASVALVDPYCNNNNPAGMAFHRHFVLGVSYQNSYLIKELGVQSLCAALPIHSGVLGINLAHTGSYHYRIVFSGLSYARILGERFSAGIKLDLIHTKIGEGYGSRTSPTCEAGIMLRLTDQLLVATHVFNPVRSRLSQSNDERIPTIFKSGIWYSFSPSLGTTAEICKHSSHPPEFRGGIEYSVNRNCHARAGMATNPFRYTFGFGVSHGKLQMDIGAMYHGSLGVSMQGGVVVCLGRD
jgi:hypothetical protein